MDNCVFVHSVHAVGKSVVIHAWSGGGRALPPAKPLGFVGVGSLHSLPVETISIEHRRFSPGKRTHISTSTALYSQLAIQVVVGE